MMKRKKLIFQGAIALCMIVIAFTACQEEVPYNAPIVGDKPGLYFNIFGGESATRALGADTSKINNLYAVYFRRSKTAAKPFKDEQYVYLTHEAISLSGTPDLSNVTTYSLAADGIVSNGTCRDTKVVFLANLSNTNYSTFPSETKLKNTTLTDFRNKIVVTKQKVGTDSVSMWKKTDAKYIPMYVCTDSVNIPKKPYDNMYYINGSGNTTARTYQLLRMMAQFKIKNVPVADKDLQTDVLFNYKITEATLINGLNTGYVCQSDQTGEDFGYATPRRVVVPSVPAVTTDATGVLCADTVSKNVTPNKLTTAANDFADWKDDTNQEIVFYTFETKSLTNADTLLNNTKNCYIHLKGTRVAKKVTPATAAVEEANIEYMLPIYKLKGAYTAAPTVSKTSAGPILRNHSYEYTIKGVMKYSLRVNLQVRPWTKVEITDATPLPL